MTAIPVPAKESDVTPAWLNQALAASYPAIAARAVRRERIGAGFGLAGQLYRCRLQADQGPTSVVAKLWATDSPAGTREATFYRQLAPKFGAGIPVCYYTAVDEERQRGVLLLEDLDDVIQGDCLQQLPLPRALALTHLLAAVHAAWQQQPELAAAGWLPAIGRLEREAGWFASRRALFLERFADRLDPFARRLMERIESLAARANERLSPAPETLLHADLHLDNVLFQHDSGQPVLLDWARAARGPAALDLADLLFFIGRPADFNQLFTAYIQALRRGGVQADEAALHDALGGALFRKFISATCGVARWQPASAREAAMIAVGLRRALDAVAMWRQRDPALFQF
jgi:fructosamine-3-kinase